MRFRGWLFVLPALAMYTAFVLWPLLVSVNYSLFDWNGIGAAEWVGFRNYQRILTDRAQLTPIFNALKLIAFFTVVPVTIGLMSAAVLHDMRSRYLGAYRTLLFFPQVIPLVASGIVWGWIYSPSGILNQGLSWVGLGAWTRPWLADFNLAFPAVGVVGAWVLTGFCTLLLSAGISKIDPNLYDAAKVDGAGRFREFKAVTLPGVRREIGVCVIVTMIGALASFDIVFITTRGGPGRETLVPGVQIFRAAFVERRIGAASAMAVILMLLIWALVLPVQRYFQRDVTSQA
ncbi:carbohydrate ABC transporter permease [Candidatus Poriferisodalis sp.]|uniref:carbohydrate ABC transporter permease n=1 Tax=Candidatus Poriferisodalis sp. TaxID=3101277 RepID=UPI003B5B215A